MPQHCAGERNCVYPCSSCCTDTCTTSSTRKPFSLCSIEMELASGVFRIQCRAPTTHPLVQSWTMVTMVCGRVYRFWTSWLLCPRIEIAYYLSEFEAMHPQLVSCQMLLAPFVHSRRPLLPLAARPVPRNTCLLNMCFCGTRHWLTSAETRCTHRCGTCGLQQSAPRSRRAAVGCCCCSQLTGYRYAWNCILIPVPSPTTDPALILACCDWTCPNG